MPTADNRISNFPLAFQIAFPTTVADRTVNHAISHLWQSCHVYGHFMELDCSDDVQSPAMLWEASMVKEWVEAAGFVMMIAVCYMMVIPV